MVTVPRHVGLLVHDRAEMLDLCGPFEVFAVTRDDRDAPLFEVFTVAESREPLTTNTGLTIIPHYDFSDHPPIDILVVLGGSVTPQLENPAVMDWLARQIPQAQYRLSVCTGVFFYARLGLLGGVEATTHHYAYDTLQAESPSTAVRTDVRFVDNDTLLTSAGISSGIDMALHLVARLHGLAAAERTASHLEYAWSPDTESRGSS